MSRRLPFTKAGLKRAISAAQERGLRVAGIAPDGTLLLADDKGAPLAPRPPAGQTAPPSPDADAWGDVEA